MGKYVKIVFAAALLLQSACGADACTSFRVTTKDGSIIIGRSLEGGDVFGGEIVVFPRGYGFSATLPDGKKGMEWKTKYGFVAVCCFGRTDGVTDGMNEAGLSVGNLLLPGYAEYQKPTDRNASRSIAYWQVGSWLLSNFTTVEDIRTAINGITVFLDKDEKIPEPIPLHYIIFDAKGGAIVIEYVKGELHIYDNPVGVATNSPPFDWHLANLRNYVNLTNVNVDSLKLGGYTVTSIGQGSGLHGLPGDYTPPSRFVRATAMVYAAQPVADAAAGTNLVFHILNTVDIPLGASVSKSADGNNYYDHTTWTTGHDVTNKIFYFRTYGNLTIRKIDMKALDFAASDVKRIEMMGGGPFLDVTKDAK